MPHPSFSTSDADPLNTASRPVSRRAVLALMGIGPLVGRIGARSRQTPSPVELFDGTSLGKWKPVAFGGEGEVSIVDGAIRLERGNDLTGVVWTGKVPGPSFLVQMEARRIDGTDFFCAVTVPVAGRHCTFVVGGWGGTVVGFSSLDGLDASENETSRPVPIDDGRWYRVGVDVTPGRLQGLLDGVVVADAALAGREVDVRIEMLPCRPMGIASWRTTSEIRAITLLERS